MGYLEWLRDLAEHNQFFSGVAGVSMVGGVIYWLRALPTRLMDWAVWASSIQIEIGNDSVLFGPIERWMADRSKSWHQRTFKVVTDGARYDDEGEMCEAPFYRLSPGRGSHWLRHKGALYHVRRNVMNEQNAQGTRVRETLYIRTPGWSRARVGMLLDEARATLEPRESLAIYIRRGMHWTLLDLRRPRPLDSLILRPGLIESVVADIENFRARVDWYVERGVPYRRGLLFVGGPGGGKSSAAMALAGYFRLPLYVLNLGSMTGDNDLIDAVSDVPAQSMLLVEDIDATSAAARREPGQESKEGKLTLSALLNCVDGPMAKEGRILIMTSNHPERIDPALTRPGRVDMTVEFPVAGAAEAARLFERFFPDAPRLAAALAQRYHRVRSAAEIQDVCLAHLDDPAAALAVLVGSANGEFKTADTTFRVGPDRCVS